MNPGLLMADGATVGVYAEDETVKTSRELNFICHVFLIDQVARSFNEFHKFPNITYHDILRRLESKVESNYLPNSTIVLHTAYAVKRIRYQLVDQF